MDEPDGESLPVKHRIQQIIDRALFVRIEVQEGEEDEFEDVLRSALDDVRAEDGTLDRYAVKFGTRDFAIFDAFGGEKDRLTHLAGRAGRALIAHTPSLLSGVPKVEHAEVLTFK